MAKPRQVPVRRETSAAKRKARMNRYLRYGLLSLAAVVAAILLSGVYTVVVARPREPVAVVGYDTISTRDYQALVRYNRLNIRAQMDSLQAQLASLDPNDENSAFIRQWVEQQLQSLQTTAAYLPSQTLEDMISDDLVRQEAARRGITASKEEVEKEAETFFGYDPNPPTPTTTPDLTATAQAAPTGGATLTDTPAVEGTPLVLATADGTDEATASAEGTPAPIGTPEPTPTTGPTPTPLPTPTPMTREGYERLRANYLSLLRDQAGVSEAAFLRMMETRVLRRKLQTAMEAEVPTTATQVHVREITVASQEDLDKALARLSAGEDFALVAKEVSQSPSAEQGGDVGWVSEWSTSVAQAVVERLLQMQPGERDSAPSYLGYQVFEVIEREENRPLDEATLQQRRAAALTTWLDGMLRSDTVKRYWSSAKVPADTAR